MPLHGRWWAPFNSCKAPLMIKPLQPRLGAKGKQADLATLPENAPLLVLRTTFPPMGELFSSLPFPPHTVILSDSEG